MRFEKLKTISGNPVIVKSTACGLMTNLFNDGWRVVTNNVLSTTIENACTAPNPEEVLSNIRDLYDSKKYMLTKPYTPTVEASTPQAKEAVDPTTASRPTAKMNGVPKTDRSTIVRAVQRFVNFLSEFKLQANARLVNTIAFCTTPEDARTYLCNYATLSDNCDASAIAEKTKSAEFDSIMSELLKQKPSRRINRRLAVWYGDAGTGKTTNAVKTYPTAKVVPCNSSMLPDDLMRTFDFTDTDGKPVFKPSVIRTAMENGETVILDEINLLTFDALRLLQTLTDNKDEIFYNGEKIKIDPAFRIVGTMNLTVNDQTFALPEPLVDRCSEIVEFKLTADQIVDYAF